MLTEQRILRDFDQSFAVQHQQSEHRCCNSVVAEDSTCLAVAVRTLEDMKLAVVVEREDRIPEQ